MLLAYFFSCGLYTTAINVAVQTLYGNNYVQTLLSPVRGGRVNLQTVHSRPLHIFLSIQMSHKIHSLAMQTLYKTTASSC